MANECGKYCNGISAQQRIEYQQSQSNNAIENPIETLKEFIDFLNYFLSIVRKESSLFDSGSCSARTNDLLLLDERKQIHKKLEDFVSKLKNIRLWWQGVNLEERSKHKEIPGLIQQAQSLAFQIIANDRENEQKLLRLGKLPPGHIPSVQSERPHYVARLYARQSKPF